MFGLPTSWLLGAVAALWLASAGGLYLKGRSDANGNCRAAQLAAALAIAQQDLAITQRAAQQDRDAVERVTAERRADQERIEAYERTLASRDPCALSPADLDSLRQLGGPR
jgi:hypothetical protein